MVQVEDKIKALAHESWDISVVDLRESFSYLLAFVRSESFTLKLSFA